MPLNDGKWHQLGMTYSATRSEIRLYYDGINWETLSTKLNGKLHIATGDMDSYYLDNAVYLLDEFLNNEAQPKIETEIQYGRRKPHCWTGYSPNNPGEDMSTKEFVRIAADHMAANAPANADLRWFKR